MTHLVDGDPVLAPISEPLKEHPCKVDEIIDDLRRGERAVAVLEGLGVIPVKDGDAGLDAGFEQGIDLGCKRGQRS
jgi:hypothetical protein